MTAIGWVRNKEGTQVVRDTVSGHGGDGLMVGLDDLSVLSNLKESMIMEA